MVGSHLKEEPFSVVLFLYLLRMLRTANTVNSLFSTPMSLLTLRTIEGGVLEIGAYKRGG